MFIKYFKGAITMSMHEHNHEHNHNQNHEHNHEHEQCENHCCGCCHSHCGHSESETKRLYIRILIGAVLFALSFTVPVPYKNIISVAAYLVLGFDILQSSFKNLIHGEIFDETFLMSIAALGAIAIGEYTEAAAVTLFYQAGEILQTKASSKSKKSISALMDIRPDYANLQKDGGITVVSPDKVKVGDIIVVKTGEKIPLDGEIIDGSAALDMSSLSGESLPVSVGTGDSVLSGSINTNGLLTIRTTKTFSDSTASRILELIENSTGKKTHTERFITRFAKVYTPVVVAAAALLAFIPPIFVGNLSEWIYRALVFLVVSCPCALVISVPLGFFCGIGSASQSGILIKGSSYLEALSKLNTVVFDKTGTLTEGKFSLNRISANIDENEFLKIAAHTEYFSQHPLAEVVKNAYDGSINPEIITNYTELAGYGIEVFIDGVKTIAGNRRLMSLYNIDVPTDTDNKSIIYFARGNEYIGCIEISDTIKSDSKYTVTTLKNQGINVVMLTGDKKSAAERDAGVLGISKTFSELLPADKVSKTEELLSNIKSPKTLAFVGDGINDAPVLALADVGIAMGALGSDAAIEASDVVLMNDEPSKILKASAIAKRTMFTVKFNIVFALAAKIIIMGLSLFGYSSMWLAIFGDVGVALLTVLNSTLICFGGNKVRQ